MRALVIALALLATLATPAAEGPGSRRADVRVEVLGIEDELHDNVVQFLSLARYRDSPDLSDAMVERLHARAADEVRAALKPFGYYRPKVESLLEPTERGWIARYTVDPGEPTRLVAFDVAFEGPGQDLSLIHI